MKNAACALLAVLLIFSVIGCEDADSDAKKLTFENASSYEVQVISLTSEWGGFVIPPGETVKLNDVNNVDYIYRPQGLVQEGSSSSERYIIFVNLPPAGF